MFLRLSYILNINYILYISIATYSYQHADIYDWAYPDSWHTYV